MPRSTDHIVTTHAGSLPRPEDVVEMIWAGIEQGGPPTRPTLDERLDRAVAEIVAKQRDAGVEVVSDGELSKPGFSNYINDRFTGFEGRAEFQADDVADVPEPRDAPVQHAGDGAPRVRQLRRARSTVKDPRRRAPRRRRA